MVGTLIWSGVLLLDWLGVVPGESLLLLAVTLVAITSRVCEVGILRPRPVTHPWGVACGGPAAACTSLATVWGVLALGRHLYVAPGELPHASTIRDHPAHRPETFHAHSQTVGASAMFLSSTGGLLLTLSRLMTDESGWSLLTLAIVQTCTMIVLVVVGSTSERQARRIYAAAHAIEGVLVVNALAGLSFWERVEIVAVTVGFVILASGHHRWLHEEDSKPDPLVDDDLLLGSLLMASPLMIGVLWQRLGDYAPPAWLQGFHASGGLLVGLGLLAAGVTCKMRATTMVGTLSLGLWLFSLFGLIDLPELETAAIQMMVGGGLLFAAAVALSVYRDRLLAIPGQVRQREGVFQILEWR